MKKFILLSLSLLFILLTFLLNLLARHFYLYWQTDWIDSLAHLFGGLGATFFIYYFKKISFFQTLAYVLVIGILWEIFEYNFGSIIYSSNYIPDTLTDLLMDLIGGAIGYLMVKYIFNSWPKN